VQNFLFLKKTIRSFQKANNFWLFRKTFNLGVYRWLGGCGNITLLSITTITIIIIT